MLTFQDREEALRDDFQFSGSYEYGEDEEWADEEANWNGEPETVEQTEIATEVKDESAAYLEFLNEEVSIPSKTFLFCLIKANDLRRLKNLAVLLTTRMTTI